MSWWNIRKSWGGALKFKEHKYCGSPSRKVSEEAEEQKKQEPLTSVATLFSTPGEIQPALSEVQMPLKGKNTLRLRSLTI